MMVRPSVAWFGVDGMNAVSHIVEYHESSVTKSTDAETVRLVAPPSDVTVSAEMPRPTNVVETMPPPVMAAFGVPPPSPSSGHTSRYTRPWVFSHWK